MYKQCINNVNMKKEKIIIRVDAYLKDKFKNLCDSEGVDMSDKLRQFISSEINPTEEDKMYKQLLNANPVTEKILNELREEKCVDGKKIINRDVYYSGKKIKIGDRVLFGYVNVNKVNEKDDIQIREMKVIKFHVNEIDNLYKFYKDDLNNPKGGCIPNLEVIK